MTDALSRSEVMLRAMIQHVRDYAIFMMDPEGIILTWNEGAAKMKGYDAGEIIGKSFAICYPQEDVAEGRPQAALDQASARGSFRSVGWRVRKDGTRFWAEIVITAIKEGDHLQGFTKITRDMTHRHAAQEQQRRLIETLIRAEKKERKKLAAALHDDLAQVLTALTMGLELESDAATDPAQKQALRALEEQARTATAKTRALMNDLHGPVRAEEDLAAAIRLFIDTNNNHGVDFLLENHISSALSPEQSQLSFWIVREAIVNVLKHARASRVHIAIEESVAELRISVEDDGIGFNMDEVVQETHFGLTLMQERARSAGATLAIGSAPTGGTLVKLIIPRDAS